MGFFNWFKKDSGKNRFNFISTSPEASQQVDHNKELRCPKCNRFAGNSTPRFGVLKCPCGNIALIDEYKVESK